MQARSVSTGRSGFVAFRGWGFRFEFRGHIGIKPLCFFGGEEGGGLSSGVSGLGAS